MHLIKLVTKSSLIFFCFLFGLNIHAYAQITNIYEFLEKCPQTDEAYQQIREDFEVRVNGKLANESSFQCNEPISEIPIENLTTELLVTQTMRTIYHMDTGSNGHLPWTDSTLYDWMLSRVDGVNIQDGLRGGNCCTEYDGKLLFNMGRSDSISRESDRSWAGIYGNIAFYAHEVRHTEGDGYPHNSDCGLSNGCDEVYDEQDLSPYGIQWWLNKAWLYGDINVGFGCADEETVQDIAERHLYSNNNKFSDCCGYISRFSVEPPPVLEMPEVPGGECSNAGQIVSTDFITDLPADIYLGQNYPNPFNPTTNINFTVGSASNIKLEIYNVNGQKIRDLLNRKLSSGNYSISFDAKDIPSGVYFYRLTSNEHSVSKKMVLIK